MLNIVIGVVGGVIATLGVIGVVLWRAGRGIEEAIIQSIWK